MAVSTINWDAAYAATSINASAVANAAVATTAAITNDGKIATEISVTVVYGATATAGLIVYLLRDVDGTNYEAVADKPWGFEMERAVSATYRRVFAVSAGEMDNFKVHVTNNSGASVTVTVRTRQGTFDTV